MSKVLILLVIFSVSSFAANLKTIKEDLKNSSKIVIGEVLESNNDKHLIKLNHWSGVAYKSNYIEIRAVTVLKRHGVYLFSINSTVDSTELAVSEPKRDIYEVKKMGSYQYLLRSYNSDKPMIGQMGFKSLVPYLKKELKFSMKSRAISRYEKEQSTVTTQAKRGIASVAKKNSEGMSRRFSETWLISILCFLLFIPYFLRKTRV